MRVLHFRIANFYGGPERQVHMHARAARGSRYDVRVGTFAEPAGPGAWLERIEADGIETRVIPVRSAYDPSAIPALRRLLLRDGVDVLCTHDYRTTILAAMALRGTPTRWIAFSRGYTQDDLKVRAYNVADALCLRLARRVVAVSAAQGRKLESFGIPGRKIDVVTNAIDPAMFDAVPAEDLRARFSFPPDAVVVVSGGRFSLEKGQRVLVEAAAAAVEAMPRLRFALFGDGPDHELVQARVRALGLEGRVVCPGFETNMAGCLKGADILVNPSLSEGLPNIVLEAMAMGVRPVATAVGGVPELVDDGRTGYLVPPDDVAALTDALLRAARAGDEAPAMRANARARLERDFGFDAQFRKLARVYDRVGRFASPDLSAGRGRWPSAGSTQAS